MVRPAPTFFPPRLLQRQLARVHRRLLLQTYLDQLVWCWAGALAVAVVWFFAQPLLLNAAPGWLRWSVAGVLVGLATLLAGLLAFLLMPSKLATVLSMDEKLGSKERITTWFTLTKEQAASPAGRELTVDAFKHAVYIIRVGDYFPLRVSRKALLVPLCGVLLACVAFLYEPRKGQAVAGADPEPPLANAAAIEEKMKGLKKKPEKRAAATPKTEEIEKMEAKLEEIANRPRETKEQLRERVKEMTALEDALKKREKQLSQKTQDLKQQLKQLDRLTRKEEVQEGPAKELQKALSEGNMDKAQEAVERLSKKIREDELSKKDKEDLANQLKGLEDKLQRVANQEEKKERLEQLKREGKLDAETLQRELENLKQECQKSGDLQKLAEKLGECQKCLKQGDSQGAEQKLQEAQQMMKQMGMDEQQMADVQEQLQRLQGAKESCGKGMGQQEGNGMGEGERPGGRRPVAKEGPFKAFDSKSKADFTSGKKIFDGYAPGENYRKKTTAQIAGEIQQASQEAPEAIEQQRIPKAYRDSAKGYFKNLGGQNNKEPAKEKEVEKD